MTNEIIEGWKVGAIYSASNGASFKIIEIDPIILVLYCQDLERKQIYSFNLSGNALNFADLKLLHRISDIDTRRA